MLEMRQKPVGPVMASAALCEISNPVEHFLLDRGAGRCILFVLNVEQFGDSAMVISIQFWNVL